MAVLTDEQAMLRDAAREWTKDHAPVAAYRRVRNAGSAAGFDPALYADMARMGWTAALVPADHGGADVGMVGIGVVLEEMGRTLAAAPLLTTGVIGASALLLGGSAAQQAEWLPGIVEGRVLTALALEEGPHHAPEALAMTAQGDRLSGAKRFVLEGSGATLFIVAALADGAPALFLVPADAEGLHVEALRQADGRGAANLTFDNVQTERLTGGALAGRALLDALLDRARAAVSAEMLGMMTQAFETTLDYMKTRVQFGQTIGSFQALQHRAADIYTELELTRSAVEAALAAIDADAPDAASLVALAKWRASDTLHLVSRQMIQLHGGIGMTDEHDAGLYMKRAQTLETAFGAARYHKERFGRLAGI